MRPLNTFVDKEIWYSTLLSFGATSATFSISLNSSIFSSTLNKLCAFESYPALPEDSYIIYLDADIFVAADPIPVLKNILRNEYRMNGFTNDIFCGRPWKTFQDIQSFGEFLGFYPELMRIKNNMRTFDGGYTFYGMCK
jgi:hypothetical protein